MQRGAHSFRRVLSQERRHAIVVGAAKLPTDPYKIRLPNQRDSSLRITSAEIDGSDVWVYYQNAGQGRVRFIELRWSLISPNGTQIKSGWHYADTEGGAGELDPGEKGECKLEIASDPRAETLDVRISGMN